jgi:tetraacyldisaccharide 4'-kinase
MKYLRWLLFTFSLIYGLVVIIRNWFYDAGFFKSHRFNVPIISVGNLEVGGAGKSPMTEYLIRLFKADYKLATLSRGYGRKTKGYLVAGETTTTEKPVAFVANATNPSLAAQIGDEPAQFKHKFPDITVAVCENRVAGINHLLPVHNLILMDDAYQHRAVEPGLSILLFDYNRVYQPHLLLPAGNMREPFSGRWRAQLIIISKCPATLTSDEQNRLAQKIEPLPYQQLFFTTIAYQPLQHLNGQPTAILIDNDTAVFLLTGIASASPLVHHLGGFTPHIIHHNYPDHHPFTLKNITKLAAEFTACVTEKKIIVTTEKDAQRLEESLLQALNQFPVFVLPIQVEFLNNSGQQFNKIVTEYVREHTAHNSIH